MSPERSGSTMLQMMLEAHSKIYGLPEPNLLPPLKHMGYYGACQGEIAYDGVNQAIGFQEFINLHPDREGFFLEACRAYANKIYAGFFAARPEARYFLDKTPPNVLVWDLVVKLYPRAKYVVLVRHPVAIIHSYAKSFFLGDYERMSRARLRLPEYIASTAAFLREAAVPKCVIKYEEIVANPETEAKRILQFIGLDFEPAVIDYGQKPHVTGTMGDPITAMREKKPVEAFSRAWIQAVRDDPAKMRHAEKMLAPIRREDLRDYGYPLENIWEPLKAADASPARKPSPLQYLRWYHFKRFLFLSLQRAARTRIGRRLLTSVRYYCDVLLR